MIKETKYKGYFANTNGEVIGKRGNVLTPSFNRQGYMRVGIYTNGKLKTISAHRLIAETFIDNINQKKDVNHKNGIKTDNRVNNLEWVTRAENIRHSWDNGFSYVSKKMIDGFRSRGKLYLGDKNPAARKVINIDNNEVFNTVSDAAKYVGLKRTTLTMMLNGSNKNKTNLKYYEQS